MKPLNSGHLRVLKKLSVIKRCPLFGGSLTKIVTLGTKHFVRYSRHVRCLGYLLLRGFTVQVMRLSNSDKVFAFSILTFYRTSSYLSFSQFSQPHISEQSNQFLWHSHLLVVDLVLQLQTFKWRIDSGAGANWFIPGSKALVFSVKHQP